MSFQADIVLRSVRTYTGKNEERKCDIVVSDGKILDLPDRFSGGSKTEIHCESCWALPGAIDAHVHFREPGSSRKEGIPNGSRAAANSGVTTYMDMPNTSPPTVCLTSWEEKMARARCVSRANYAFFAGAHAGNAEDLGWIDPERIPAVKVYMGSSTGSLLMTEGLEKVLANSPVPVAVHAEDEARIRNRMKKFSSEEGVLVHNRIRDVESAVIAVRSAVKASQKTGRRVHVCHLSSVAELDAAMEGGEKVSFEVAPHHLFLNDSIAGEMKNLIRVNPPVRAKDEQEKLLHDFHKGKIRMVATDHAPHEIYEKALSYQKAPSGISGIESFVPLLWGQFLTGKISLGRYVEATASEAARIYGIKNKGVVEPGYDADLIVLSDRLAPFDEKKMISRAGRSPFDGYMPCAERPRTVLICGRLAKHEGVFYDLPLGRAIRFDKNRI